MNYPQSGVLGDTLEDKLLAHLLSSRESCCGLLAHKPCARCQDALELHDNLKIQLGDKR